MAFCAPRRLIKVGGHESDSDEFLKLFAHAVARLGSGTIIVHGGGAAISALERSLLGREPVFIDGRRKTDEHTLRLAEMVLCGSVNKKIVRALAARVEIKPVGLSGVDGGLLRGVRSKQLGFVAEKIVADVCLLRELCAGGYTPVIAPLAADEDAHSLNANADEVASALAVALAIREVVFVTNVSGVVLDGRVLTALSAEDAEQHIADGSISGGMIVKVRAALDAAQQTGALVRICNLETLAEGGGTLVGDFSQLEEIEVLMGETESSRLAPLFSKTNLNVQSATGMWLQEESGRKYLDFGSGIAVNALGHGHPKIIQTLLRKSASPLHLSNLFPIPEQETLARKLTESCFAERVFFCNSGTEANEAALKFALKYHHSRKDSARTRVVALSGGFHGRTMGALAVTEKPSYRAPFSSHLFPVEFLPFNSTQVLQNALGPDVAAVIVEPVQGEAGVHIASPDFLAELRRLCDLHGIVLIFDEVQCGLMRTGTFWSHQQYQIEPDILTTAKPLGGGLPLGATLISAKISEALAVGDHGSTFGGNPLACALALVVVDEVQRLQPQIRQTSAFLREVISGLAETFPQWIAAFRGRGLMWGIDLHCQASEVVDAARERGLLLLTAGPRTVRLLPPLICCREDVSRFQTIMHGALTDMSRRSCADIQISPALADDALEIFDLLSPWSEAKVVLPRTLSSVKSGIEDFLLARWNGVVVGCIAVRKWSESVWEVRSLAVAAAVQRHGIGRKLAGALISQSKEKEVSEIFALTTSPEFFASLGFTPQPRSRYPFKEASDCISCSWASDCKETALGLQIRSSVDSHQFRESQRVATEYFSDEVV